MDLQLELNNYRLNYVLEGNHENPPILFLHGFMGDRNEFKNAIAQLSTHFYCISLDLLGHGQTIAIAQSEDLDANYTIQGTANLIINFLEILQIKRCFLVGYSMGGRLALYLILFFPQYFHKVVLESASAGLDNAKDRSDRLLKDQQLATELETVDLELFLENWYQQPVFANLRSHPNFPEMIIQRLKNSPLKLAKSLRNLSLGMQPSLWNQLSTNATPLLLIVGELDAKFVQINQQMQQLNKFIELEIIPKSGHNVHFEQPEMFAKAVTRFFKI
ncbi:2-succinyl-6-hydroxy-2,4-cyclohexadiene-1-carboxylate synthase [Pseudanabaena biceps]|nr:2-succinyl-6-hydroxy-2,4-cyclohexadiene-1-carboxylate synthase [Pseudanabaena biceps]